MNASSEKNNVCTITDRQAAFIVSGIAFSCFLSFAAGYFMGVSHETETVITEIRADAFADEIASALYARETPQDKVVDLYASVPGEIEAMSFGTQEQKEEINTEYYAQLIGFSKREAAIDCVDKWKKKGFDVQIKKRESKTAKGKTIYWYQVITQRYTSKKELEHVVELLKKQEKLKDVCIITC